MSDTLEFEPLPSSVRSARLFVVDRLQEWRCDDLVDKVALLTSELATNAVVHTGQPYSVSVERRGPAIRVEVSDRTDDLPHVRDVVDLDEVVADAGDPLLAPEADDHQRWFSGLGIVERTATAWGSEALPGAGKVVWFEVMGDDTRDGGGRSAMAELGELRREHPVHDGEGVIDDPRSFDEPQRSTVGRVTLVILVVVALSIAAVLVLG